MHARHGFTLLEMMGVLVIASLVVAVGAASVTSLAEEHELQKASLAVEQVFMQAVHQAAATVSPQVIVFDEKGLAFAGAETTADGATQRVLLPAGTRLTLRRLGSDVLVPAAGQRVLLRSGGLCEPLGLLFERQGSTLRATLDPLTGGLLDIEEHFQR